MYLKKESYVITKPTSIRKPSRLQKDVQEGTGIRSVTMQVIQTYTVHGRSNN